MTHSTSSGQATAFATRHDTRALVQPDASLPAPAEFQQMQAMAEVIHASGMFPTHKNWQAILTCMIKGRELGIPATEAMQQIYMIQGKATCSANLMLALVQRDHGSRAMYVDLQRSDATKATVVYRDPLCRAQPRRLRLQLGDGGSWPSSPRSRCGRQYPANMLVWRAVSTVARAVYPSSVAGMYTPEELGASIQFDDEGYAVIDVPGEGISEPSGSNAWPATDRQIGYMKGLCRDIDWSRDELAGYVLETFGVSQLEELSREQASQVIERIKLGERWVDPRQQRLEIETRRHSRRRRRRPVSVDEQLRRDIASVSRAGGQRADDAARPPGVKAGTRRSGCSAIRCVAAAIENARRFDEREELPAAEQEQQALDVK